MYYSSKDSSGTGKQSLDYPTYSSICSYFKIYHDTLPKQRLNWWYNSGMLRGDNLEINTFQIKITIKLKLNKA